LSTLPLEKTAAPAEPKDTRAVRRVLDQRPLIIILLIIAGVSTVCIGTVLAWFLSLPDIRSVADYRPEVATLVLDRRGRPIDAIAHQFRIVIPYSEMPPLLPRAFVAAEDSRFWEHTGLDGWSITRAAVNNLLAGRRSQGGSTITQQITRGLLLTREKSYLRKMAEAVLAHRIERMLTKEEILYLYLNEIYLGEGAYGVEAAARTYFNKRARDLDLGEIAVLAGLPQSPSNYSPLRNPDAARARQRYVLNRMAEDNIVTAEAARAAWDQGLRTSANWRRAVHGYFSLYVRSQLLTRFSEEDLFRKGLTVATTVDSVLQLAAAQAVREGAARVAERHPKEPSPQGALVALDTASGRILAMVGGADYHTAPFNRAVQANRQPGSAFKPIVYATALEQGVPSTTVLRDTPLALPSGTRKLWRPGNFRGEYRGSLNLAEALVCSSNVVAVRLLRQTGVPSVVRLAKRLGISAELQPDLTLVLGSSPVSVLELTAAYTAFANQGIFHAPVGITRVTERDGRITFWPQPRAERVLSVRTADWLQAVLVQVVQRGTGKNAKGVRGASGKTGTTDNNIDAWFVGSAPGLTTGVWIGHDRSASLGAGETGGRAAAPVWQQFMQLAVR
jgi:penicillin-binding protein 1A